MRSPNSRYRATGTPGSRSLIAAAIGAILAASLPAIASAEPVPVPEDTVAEVLDSNHVEYGDRRLWFRMREFECGDETGSTRIGELGSDEMWMTGIAGGGTEGFVELPLWHIGSFDDGDSKRYASRSNAVYSWNLDEIGTWPQDFSMTLILIEADGSNVSRSDIERMRSRLAQASRDKWDEVVRDYVKDIPEWADEAADMSAEQLRKWAMTSLAESGPLGAGAALLLDDASKQAEEVVANNLAELVGGINFADDVFVPNTATITINRRDQNFPGEDGERHTFTTPRWLFWNDHNSAYRVHFDWQVWSGVNEPFWEN